MPPLKPGAIRPTPEENEEINAGIAADPDNPEATEEEFERMRPMTEADPEFVARYRKDKGSQGSQSFLVPSLPVSASAPLPSRSHPIIPAEAGIHVRGSTHGEACV